MQGISRLAGANTPVASWKVVTISSTDVPLPVPAGRRFKTHTSRCLDGWIAHTLSAVTPFYRRDARLLRRAAWTAFAPPTHKPCLQPDHHQGALFTLLCAVRSWYYLVLQSHPAFLLQASHMTCCSPG